MTIIDFAIQMEQDGKAMYLELAQKASTANVRRVFQMMADDEQKHHDIFVAIKNSSAPSMNDSGVLENTQNVFRNLGALREELTNMEGDLPVYTRAMEIEAKSVQLYREAAQKETKPANQALLEKIADEEQKHYNILENMYLFASAPTQYMEWQEFTSTDTFEGYSRQPED